MKLSQLTGQKHDQNPDILGLTADSRVVAPGFLFAALSGSLADGRNFVTQALERGAVAILSNAPIDIAIPVIIDPEPRQRLAMMASQFYPAIPNFMAGITGTNGKTSTAQFCQQLWYLVGKVSGSLGTLGVHGHDIDGRAWSLPLRHTTPDPVTLHQALSVASSHDCSHMAMEVSSHGLAQFRVDGVRFDVTAFTNLTQDHLDYHPTFDDYFLAKRRLFTHLLKPKAPIIVNMDGQGSGRLIRSLDQSDHPIIRTGCNGHDLVLTRATPMPEGLGLAISTHDKQTFELVLPLLGIFQAENALLAAAIVMASGYRADQIIPLLAKLTGVAGRMMLAGSVSGAGIYVDYAHTPDAVETVLKAARPHTQGRLIVIIGAGGDRDRTKRPIMGKAAATLADLVILADDNPRSEDPALIRAQILEGAPRAINIGQRADAIAYGIDQLEAGDVLMILGKGHETGQTIGDRTLPFDDCVEVHKLVGKFEMGRQ